MREIKFRAWDKKENKMYYVPCIWFSLHVADLGMGEKNHQLGYDHIELMQYTGLDDENGKEIYEGDILEMAEYDLEKYPKGSRVGVIKIIWNKYGAAFNSWDELNGNQIFGNTSSSYRIIGNICENPELLK